MPDPTDPSGDLGQYPTLTPPPPVASVIQRKPVGGSVSPINSVSPPPPQTSELTSVGVRRELGGTGIHPFLERSYDPVAVPGQYEMPGQGIAAFPIQHEMPGTHEVAPSHTGMVELSVGSPPPSYQQQQSPR
jgi:hypothetical protein